MKKNIILTVLDIDGILTDGKVAIDDRDREYKIINYRDLDGVNYLRGRGIKFALLTGEDTALVDKIAKKFKIDNVIKGAKDKADGLIRLSEMTGVPIRNICYLGDSDRDAEGLKLAGMSFTPADATIKAKKAALHIFKLKGGEGLVQELKEYLLENRYLDNKRKIRNLSR